MYYNLLVSLLYYRLLGNQIALLNLYGFDLDHQHSKVVVLFEIISEGRGFDSHFFCTKYLGLGVYKIYMY